MLGEIFDLELGMGTIIRIGTASDGIIESAIAAAWTNGARSERDSLRWLSLPGSLRKIVRSMVAWAATSPGLLAVMEERAIASGRPGPAQRRFHAGEHRLRGVI